MKTVFQITFIVLTSIALLTSCNKGNSSSCKSDVICHTAAPDSLWVKLDLSNESYSDPISVKFYFGNMDDGELYDEFITTNEQEYYLVPVDKRYTATARYLIENDTIVVIDNERLSRSSCKDGETTCYDWDHEITLNLKIK